MSRELRLGNRGIAGGYYYSPKMVKDFECTHAQAFYLRFAMQVDFQFGVNSMILCKSLQVTFTGYNTIAYIYFFILKFALGFKIL